MDMIARVKENMFFTRKSAAERSMLLITLLMQRIGIQQGIHQLFSLQKPRRHMHHKQAAAEIRHILQCGTDIHEG